MSDAIIAVAVPQLLEIAYFLERLRLLDRLDSLSHTVPNSCVLNTLQITQETFPEINFQVAP